MNCSTIYCVALRSIKIIDNQYLHSFVTAIVKHCPNLQSFELSKCHNIYSLTTLSEHNLPREELILTQGWREVDIPLQQIPLCTLALSRIRTMKTSHYSYPYNMNRIIVLVSYFTGIRELWVNSMNDHMLLPRLFNNHLSLEKLIIGSNSTATDKQVGEFIQSCSRGSHQISITDHRA